MEYREEHRREAMIGTVIIHLALAAVFIFTVFKGPDPPLDTLGGDGVELNYGVDEAGSGDIQSLAPANDSKNLEDSRPPAANPNPQPKAVAAATPQPAVRTPPADEKVITSEAEDAPVKVPPVEKSSPPKEVVRETRPVVAETPAPPKPVEKARTLYTPRGTASGGGNGVNGTSNMPTGNNNGDRPGAVGDQGDPNGSLDAKALYGKPGSGGSGSSPGSGNGALNMPGWAFENRPRDQDPSSESGRVVLRIKIDEDGNVDNVTVVSTTVSPQVANFYRDMVQRKATFKRVASGSGGATGTIVYVIGSH
ncbi:hypothetical protein [Hymenobacter sp. GOD-10R]|uniref:hypothetical protein n=1 Tax=Hymenobacter sp. GOD-10R TaxID=3093922 RepID=UPI002D79D6D9|nr:hypothetical protein [Hymenobacter sp. GOD-10R]WRQ26188.1 hypothetical protein SD425_13980 [Hymenobacter sp. GOD-10R]